MLCPACTAPNEDSQNFCLQCGSRLGGQPTVCGVCHAPAQPRARFCGQCGAPLATDQASGVPFGVPSGVPTPRARTPVAERRVCSVLFVDLVGFTSLSEGRDVEQVRELLSSYFGLARTIVARYGGTLEKFIGDAVMAVWGAPTAHDDDSERAVRAALELVEAVRVFGAENALDLQARAGVVTDSVAVTIGADSQGMVAGDAVNTASRIQSVAAPGTVLVDESTRGRSAAAIGYDPAGSQELKGKARPVDLFRATRVVAHVGGQDRVDGLEPAFLGRDRELRTLKEVFHEAGSSGRSAMVTVVGVAGTGKTRLRWEFSKYTDGLVSTTLWHEGRCLPYGDGVAYWALAQMVRQRLGIAEEEAADAVDRKLDEGLVRWVPNERDRAHLAPALRVLLGTSDEQLPREELFASWRFWFEQLAEHDQVVMVVDDLQWADAGLLDFLEHLLEWAASSPVLVLALTRPDLLERRPGWGTGRRGASMLRLDPLGLAAMTALLEDLVPDLPAEARSRIVAAAGGIPMYAVELVRSLVDRDVLRPVQGVYRLVGEVDDLAVPASLTSLITARIDNLGVDERALVAGLSVLGATFPRSAVGAVCALPAEQADALLARLVRREILTVRSERLSPELGQYAFTQALTRTVAYGTLSRHDRRAMHLEVAAHLRHAFPDDGVEVAELVAAHYRDAYDAVPDAADADHVRRQAVTAYERAALRATALGAPEAALHAHRVAAELAADDLETRAWNLHEAGEAANRIDDQGLAERLFAEAEAAFLSLGRRRDAAWSRSRLLDARAQDRGLTEQDVAGMWAALEVLDEEEDLLAAKATANFAASLQFAGRVDEASRLAERALVIATGLGDAEASARATMIKGLVLQRVNRNEEALMYYRWSADVGRSAGLAREELRGHLNAGDVCLISDLPGAVDHSRAALELSRRIGDRLGETVALGNLVLSLVYLGDWEEAQRHLLPYLADLGPGSSTDILLRCLLVSAVRGDIAAGRQAFRGLATAMRSADLQDRGCAAAAAALLAAAEGDLAAAAERGQVALDAGLQLGVRHESVRVGWPAALDALIRLHRIAEARDTLQRVGGIQPGHLSPYLRAEVARFRGRLAAVDREADGDLDAALEDMRQAEAAMRALGYPYFLACVLADRAAVLHVAGRDAEAEHPAAEATATFTRLGAAPALLRLRQELGLAAEESVSVQPGRAAAG